MISLFSYSVAVFLSSIVLATAGSVPKKLIEFGWDEPGTHFLREHIREMEKTPFDGCVFHVQHKQPGGQEINLTWECWGTRTFTDVELQPAFDDLRAIKPGRFTHNFLRFNVTPGTVDWFDDFSAICTNAMLAAQLAREGKCAGILFDIEPYSAPLWDFRQQKNATAKSWSDYDAQVRRRGSEVMHAFQKGFPGVTVFLTFGYSIAWAQMDQGKRSRADCQYGLLPAFLDGMIDSAKGKTRIVDGCELAYGFKDLSRFDAEYRIMKRDLLPIVGNTKKYDAVMSLGFGLWMDNDWRKIGWATSDFTKNFYVPAQFEASVRKALETADEYVWIYTEQPRWWTENGPSTNLPPAYADAVRNAHNAIKRK